jgi:hypothetical protein
MTQLPKLALCLVLAAGPAAAQTSGCVRDASGALHCAVRPAPSIPNAARRPLSTRDLSAAAVARGRAQVEAIREAAERHRNEADARAAHRHELACPGSPDITSASQPPAARPCSR